MNLVIQMMMLIAGAIIPMRCKGQAGEIANGAVFKAGMVAIFSVFGVARMSEPSSRPTCRCSSESLSHVAGPAWTYALVLFLIRW